MKVSWRHVSARGARLYSHKIAKNLRFLHSAGRAVSRPRNALQDDCIAFRGRQRGICGHLQRPTVVGPLLRASKSAVQPSAGWSLIDKPKRQHQHRKHTKQARAGREHKRTSVLDYARQQRHRPSERERHAHQVHCRAAQDSARAHTRPPRVVGCRARPPGDIPRAAHRPARGPCPMVRRARGLSSRAARFRPPKSAVLRPLQERVSTP